MKKIIEFFFGKKEDTKSEIIQKCICCDNEATVGIYCTAHYISI